jgi:hypothetical protein
MPSKQSNQAAILNPKETLMKRILFACLALSAITLCACSTPPSSIATAASPTAATTATIAAMNTAEMEKNIIDLERKTWELYQKKQVDEYKKYLASGYRAVYNDAIKDANQDAENMRLGELKEYSLMDEKVTFPHKDTAVMTFKFTSKSTYKGKDTSGAYHASAVWVNQDGKWKVALYQETKVEPQPKK